MALEFKLPELGENIESGDVTRVAVAVGDVVSEGQTLLEIEAGKATMEIPSPADGTVTVLHVQDGDSVAPGQLAVEIETGDGGQKSEDGGQPASPEATPSQGAEDGGQKTDDGGQKTEDGGQKTEDGGQRSEEAEPESESELETRNPEPARPAELEERRGETRNSEPETSPPPPATRHSPPATPVAKALAVSASPKVRKLARELGVDVHLVPASGPCGYITVEDVKAYARDGLSSGGAAPAAARATRVEKMSSVRKATMKHMAHCWATIPHVTEHDMADITELEALRKRYAPKAESVGAKLTMTAMLIKVIASALKVHPKFNCSIDADKGEIIYKDYYNIGIAMDTPKGLLVPVIQDGDKKNMVELAVELKELAEKARAGTIGPDDMKDGTFTFTNIGIIGGSYFTPIVNSPEVAILGSGRASWEACPDGGDKRFKLPLSLSYDHRIIDGADGARFMKWVIDAIQDPLLLSLEG